MKIKDYINDPEFVEKNLADEEVISIREIRNEFNHIVSRYKNCCNANGGHEGSINTLKYRFIAEFLSEFAEDYFGETLWFERKF